MITAIVLDWGGVLDRAGHASIMSKHIQQKYGIPYMSIINVLVPLLKKLNRNLISFEELRHGVNEQLNIKISEKEMWGLLEKSFDINHDLIPLIKKLKKNYSVFMLSNNNKPLVKAIQTAHPEVFNLFDKHYFSFELNLRKPDVQIFEHFFKDSGRKPSECVFIDDNEENITVSKQLGMKGILYKDNEQLKRELLDIGVV